MHTHTHTHTRTNKQTRIHTHIHNHTHTHLLANSSNFANINSSVSVFVIFNFYDVDAAIDAAVAAASAAAVVIDTPFDCSLGYEDYYNHSIVQKVPKLFYAKNSKGKPKTAEPRGLISARALGADFLGTKISIDPWEKCFISAQSNGHANKLARSYFIKRKTSL